MEVLRRLSAGDWPAEDEEVDPHHQPAARRPRGRGPHRTGFPVHQWRRQSRSRTGVLQRWMETRPRQRHEGWAHKIAARARPPAHVCFVDDSRWRSVAGDPAAPRARVDPDDDRRVWAFGSSQRSGRRRRHRVSFDMRLSMPPVFADLMYVSRPWNPRTAWAYCWASYVRDKER